jgi:pilus assembly protein CpaE
VNPDHAAGDPWGALAWPDDTSNRVPDQPRHAADPSVVVVGAVGGCGATTVACAIATHLAARGGDATLVEFDLDRGDLAGRWDVPAERTIDDLAPVADELRPDHVELVALRHPAGPRLLLGPRRPGAAGAWTPDRAGALIDAVRTLGPAVVDAGGFLGPHVAAACAATGRAVVVAPPTLCGARAVRSVIAALRGWHPAVAIDVAANRGVGRDHLGDRAFAHAVGHPIAVFLPRADRDADGYGGGRRSPRGRGAFERGIERLAGGAPR